MHTPPPNQRVQAALGIMPCGSMTNFFAAPWSNTSWSRGVSSCEMTSTFTIFQIGNLLDLDMVRSEINDAVIVTHDRPPTQFKPMPHRRRETRGQRPSMESGLWPDCSTTCTKVRCTDAYVPPDYAITSNGEARRGDARRGSFFIVVADVAGPANGADHFAVAVPDQNAAGSRVDL